MKQDETEAKAKAKARSELWRTVQIYGLLMLALCVINVFIYIERGSRLSLVVAGVAAVALVAYLAFARRQFRGL